MVWYEMVCYDKVRRTKACSSPLVECCSADGRVHCHIACILLHIYYAEQQWIMHNPEKPHGRQQVTPPPTPSNVWGKVGRSVTGMVHRPKNTRINISHHFGSPEHSAGGDELQGWTDWGGFCFRQSCSVRFVSEVAIQLFQWLSFVRVSIWSASSTQDCPSCVGGGMGRVVKNHVTGHVTSHVNISDSLWWLPCRHLCWQPQQTGVWLCALP